MSNTSNISASTTIRGRISVEGDIDVFGQVEGAIQASGEVTIAAGALIKSTVQGRRVSVRGAVAGDLSASELLVLEPDARMVGDIAAPTIGVRPGALLRGKVETGGAPSAARSRATVQTTRAAAKPAAVSQQKPAAKSTPKKKQSSRRAPAPVIPKASGRGKKAAATKTKRAAAPKPQVKALKKRTKKTSKRRAKAR